MHLNVHVDAFWLHQADVSYRYKTQTPVVFIGCLFAADSSKQRLLRSMSPDRYKPTDPLVLFQGTATSYCLCYNCHKQGGVRFLNRPKGCPRYIGQCTFSRHEYPGFNMDFIGWITDLMMCVSALKLLEPPKKLASPQKRACIQQKTLSLPTTCDTRRCCVVWRLRRRNAV